MAIHAPITGAQTRAPFIPVPPAAISRVLSQFDRDQLAGFIAVAIDLLDLADGDPDTEATGDEQDASYPEANAARQAVINGRAPGHENAEQDDEPEDDGDVADGNGSEDDFMRHASNGPGCPIADTGVFGDIAHHDDRPIADPAASREHRDFIRATRCDRIVSRYQYRGTPIVEWRLPA